MSNKLGDNLILPAKDAVVQAFDWGQLSWFANAEIGNTQAMTVGQCILKSGCENPRHSHPNCEEILLVVQGTIMHSLADEEFEMGPGDTIVIPPNLIHNARNVGSTDAVLTIVFSSAQRQTVGEF